jgi:hypothetical protein
MAEGTTRSQDQARSQGGVEFSTLVVAALASVIAAFITSKLWAPGALFSTAMTPVIVALVKEWLERPARKVTEAAKAPLVAVRAVPSQGIPSFSRRPALPEAEQRGRPLEPPIPDPDEYERLETLVPPGEEGSTATPYRVYRRRSRRRTWWAVGLVTGVLGFVVAAVAITVPELVGGGSVAGTGSTTLFGHHHGRSASSGRQDTTTTTTPTTTSGRQTTPSATTEQRPQSTTTTPQSTTPTQTTTQGSGGASPRSTPAQTAPTSTQPSSTTGGG